MTLRKVLMWVISIIVFLSLLLRFTLKDDDYEKIRPYERPIVVIAFVGYLGLYLTRGRYDN